MVDLGSLGGGGGGASADPLERANERIRGAAKWLIASSAAVGAALIAGSQLSSIGKLDVGLPTSTDKARLWIAGLGVVIGLAGVVFSIWTAVQLLLPKTVLISELSSAWSDKYSRLRPVVDFFKRNRKYLQGYETPAEAIAEREELIAELNADDSDEDTTTEAAELEAAIIDVDARIREIEDAAGYQLLRADFEATLRRLIIAAVVVALGIVAFAWAANPPDKPAPSADLSGSSLVGAYLRDVDLRGAVLDHSDLSGADLTGADLTGASIIGVTWDRTTCPDATISDDNGGTCAGHLSK